MTKAKKYPASIKTNSVAMYKEINSILKLLKAQVKVKQEDYLLLRLCAYNRKKWERKAEEKLSFKR